ncbi:MAG: endonuclease/exonuclease/phosphatase family protein [Solirubrobacterales bacterium]
MFRRVSSEPSFRGRAVALLALAGAMAALPAVAQAKPGHKQKGSTVTVMTRNLYLGADLGPAIGASGVSDFISKNGQILRDVDTNNFPVRAKGLAREIIQKNPDLVGMQEVAMWRTGPVNLPAALAGGCRLAETAGTPCTATTVKYDYLKLLLDQLNKGKQRYRVVKVNTEFDFEAPADYDNDPSTPVGGTFGADLDGRLTMRDVILAKVGAGVTVNSSKASHFETLYTPKVSGVVDVPVTRGWLRADVKVRSSRPFRFIDTHLEAFGDPTIREAQAKELFTGAGAPAKTSLPAVLVGDLNSDDDTVSGADRLAYNALKGAGFAERSTASPLGCCLNTGILTDDLGSVSDFDHQVDHVMTRDPKVVKLVNSAVTGRQPANGYWDSDHAGLFSRLRILR